MSPPSPASSARYLLRDMEPAAQEFYRRLVDDGKVMTTRCTSCLPASFPPRLRCSRCGRPTEWVELPKRGRLHAFTTQESALRFTAPVVLALADLGDVVVPGIVELPYDSLRIGQAITVELRAEPETGLTLLRFEVAD